MGRRFRGQSCPVKVDGVRARHRDCDCVKHYRALKRADEVSGSLRSANFLLSAHALSDQYVTHRCWELASLSCLNWLFDGELEQCLLTIFMTRS